MPLEIWQEVSGSRSQLGTWINDAGVKASLILDEEADRGVLNDVLDTGYGANLTDTDLEKIGQDMFMVAYARANRAERIVVTKEVSAPSKQRGNRKLPDVCNAFGVQWMTDFTLYRGLGFTTKK